MTAIIEWLHSIIGNYGWTVVVFTILVKLILLPLDIKQRRSMQKMQELQPQIEKINAKYKNDEQKKNEKTLELYRTNKCNPLSGCLPLLIQMPILFILFAALRAVAGNEAVRMLEAVRDGGAFQPEGWLWIRNIWQPDNFFQLGKIGTLLGALFNGSLFTNPDIWHEVAQSVVPTAQSLMGLGSKETQETIKALVENQTVIDGLATLTKSYSGMVNGYFILPVLAFVSQIFMTKMTSAANAAGGQAQQGQGMQKFMTYFFPIMTLWICASYNAAFAIYWVVSNVWSIAQYIIMDQLRKHKAKQPAGEGA